MSGLKEEKTKKVTLDSIVLRNDLYPREKVNQDKVREYSEYLGVLPPVTINQDNVLVDGFHRYYAHKLKNQVVIEAEVIHTEGDEDILLKSVELNAKHGLPLTQEEKYNRVISLYQKILDGEATKYDVKRLQSTFSIPESTFSDWTKELSEKLEAQRLEKILDLHLQCKTQQEIGEEDWK